MKRGYDHDRPPDVPTKIERVAFADRYMHVQLTDGRRLSVPLSWFPVLAAADEEALARGEIVGGRALHWDELDEAIHLEGLMRIFEEKPEPRPLCRRFHVYCYQMDDGRWRAQWTRDFSWAKVGATPEEAIDLAREIVAHADPRRDVKAMVVQIDLPEADDPPEGDELTAEDELPEEEQVEEESE